MENWFRNPTLTTLISNFTSEFWIDHLKVLTTKEISEEGLIANLDNHYVPKVVVDNLTDLHTTYSFLASKFTSVDEDVIVRYMPQVLPELALRMVRTLPLVLWQMLLVCKNLISSIDCNYNLCFLQKDVVEENITIFDIHSVFDYTRAHKNATNSQYWEYFNIVIKSDVCSFHDFDIITCKENILKENNDFYNEEIMNLTNMIFSNNNFSKFDVNLGKEVVTSALSLCQSCLEVCSQNPMKYSKLKNQVIIMSFSISHLISTIMLITACALFFITPELRRNLNGKSTMYHLLALTLNYLLMIMDVTASVLSSSEDTFCEYIGSLLWFSTLSSCFWLNAICLDIFIALWRPGIFARVGESTRMKIYSAYSWGLPFIITFIIFLIDIFNPKLSTSCHFFIHVYKFNIIEGDILVTIFWDFPIGVSLLANLIIFVMTAFVLHRHARRSKILGIDSSTCSNRVALTRATIYLKLFSTVGLNWILQVYAWHNLTANFNPNIQVLGNLQGAMVFLIIVCRRTTFRAIKRRKQYRTITNFQITTNR